MRRSNDPIIRGGEACWSISCHARAVTHLKATTYPEAVSIQGMTRHAIERDRKRDHKVTLISDLQFPTTALCAQTGKNADDDRTSRTSRDTYGSTLTLHPSPGKRYRGSEHSEYIVGGVHGAQCSFMLRQTINNMPRRHAHVESAIRNLGTNGPGASSSLHTMPVISAVNRSCGSGERVH